VNFRPGEAAFATCAACHDDNNKKLYNGYSVHTPHGGTFGYPIVVDHKWNWPGLDEDEWARKPPELQEIREGWLQKSGEGGGECRDIGCKEFHALHYLRVRPAPGGGIAVDKNGLVSCSSCHKTVFPIVDRETPRTTCAKCHDGRISDEGQRTIIARDEPNCTSCHVQHTSDKHHWNPSLLVDYDSYEKPAAATSNSAATNATTTPNVASH